MKRIPGRLLRTATAIALIAVALGTASAQDSPSADGESTAVANAIVEQPRSFGYVIGDLVTQRVLLQAEGRAFGPLALPQPARLGAWLERRKPTIESAPDGRRWLVIDYQLINAPQALTTVNLPAWELTPRSGTAILRIGEWPISVAPLTPRQAFAKGGLQDLRPDRAAPLIATEPIRRQLAIWSAACIVTLAAWLGWLLWRNWRASSTQPFARALREIRRFDESAPETWHALHRAFDRTAGQIVQPATLAVLFRQAPHLAPLRAKIEQFFNQSGRLFFGAGQPAQPLSLRQLCAELRRAEKRRER